MRISPAKNKTARGFTLIELLVVMAIIIILASLILGTSGYVQKKASRARAETEIAALSAACENYKADNGIYPRSSATDQLDAKTSYNPGTYAPASLLLYNELAGCSNGSRTMTAGKKSYFAFKPNMLNPTDETVAVTAVRDPFGNSYGYSTAYQADLDNNPTSTPTHGYNPSFDLWSTTYGTASSDALQWVKNW